MEEEVAAVIAPIPAPMTLGGGTSVFRRLLGMRLSVLMVFLSSLRDQKADGTVVVAEKWEDGEEGGEWDWERWRKHFIDVDEQERIVSILKSQLANAIKKEDYEEAARIKVAIAAAARSDTVGRVMSRLEPLIRRGRGN